MKEVIKLRQKTKVLNLFKNNPEKWEECTHRDLVQIAFEFDLGVNQVVEIYYTHFMNKPRNK